jgi:hypothetical protein
VSYVALALFAVSQGYLNESSAPDLQAPSWRRSPASTTPSPRYDDEFDEEYDEDEDDGWRAIASLITAWAKVSLFGGVAQLVERYVRNVEAVGSNPITSTCRTPVIA